MAKNIRLTDPVPKQIRDTSPCLPGVDSSTVAAGLGAEPTGEQLSGALAPITLFAVREELLGRLQSNGGRPGLSGTSRRAKIPLGDSDWKGLEELAALIAVPGLSPTAGQIASVLLSLSVRSVMSKLATSSKAGSSPLARELATKSATKPA